MACKQGWPSEKEDRDPVSLTVVGEKGIAAGVICIYGEPGEIPSSSPHLKLQELY